MEVLFSLGTRNGKAWLAWHDLGDPTILPTPTRFLLLLLSIKLPSSINPYPHTTHTAKYYL